MPRMARQSARSRALNQRRHNEARASRANSFNLIVRGFESRIQSINLVVCRICSRRVERGLFQPRHERCLSCHRTAAGRHLFTAENSMDVGDVPPELQELSLVERILIARVSPIVSVFRIRGQQRGYSGHVMNFVQRIDRILTRLPSDPRHLSAILLLNRVTFDGVAQFRVRSSKVRNALLWLQINNPYYRDIVIDDAALAALPLDGNIIDRLPMAELADDQEPPAMPVNPGDRAVDIVAAEPGILNPSCFPNLEPIDANEVIERNIRRRLDLNQPIEGEIDIGEWPEIERDPLNEFTMEGVICQAFPALFPFGRGDLNAPRIMRITRHKYFKWLLQYKDGRFANDERFPYYAYNSLARWDALNCGNVFIRQNELLNANAQDILEMANNPNRDIAGSIMYYGVNLRGTRPYWRQRSSELLQMCRQLSTPTIFFTLSAADYHWPDLFRLLRPNVNPASLTLSERTHLMHDNPFTVAWFFEKRTNIFVSEVISRLFSVRDYWFRFEWQHRGSPHIHGVLWLADAPDTSDIDSLNDAERSAIVQYFDGLISATIGSLESIPPFENPCRSRYSDLTDEQRLRDVDRILSAVQRHSRCGQYCQRRRRGSRNFECRYKFPMECEDESSLRKVDGDWKFIPKRNDALLQRHNKFISQAWRGNTDFSAIVSRDAVLKYIAKYASKGEQSSPAFAQTLQQILQRNEADAPAARVVRQLLISSVAERNYSAQEVMHLIAGWPLYHCSRAFTVLSLKDDWRRFGERGVNRLIEQYANRPVMVDGRNFDGLSLYEFVKDFQVVRGTTRLRSQETIVMVTPFTRLTGDPGNDEEHYLLQCKLHIPWRNDFASIRQRNQTWRDVFDRWSEDQNPPDHDDENFPRELPEAINDYHQNHDEHADIVRNAGEALARLQPGFNQVDPLGRRVIDEAFRWTDLTNCGFLRRDVEEFLGSYKTIAGAEVARPDRVVAFDQLSEEQRQVVGLCRAQVANPNHPKRRCIVQGKAGTGKSVVIRELCRFLDSGPGGEKLYQVLAPTGQAAVNVDGTTIHNFLKIPAQGEMLELRGAALRDFQLLFRTIRFIIIDEYSMIGLRLLYKIHCRLREGTGRSDQPFGGVFLYLFGDLRQLPPVMDVPIYMNPADQFTSQGLALIRTMQVKIILSVCHRQGVEEMAFKQSLDNLAGGEVNQDDWELFMTRRQAVVMNGDEFDNAIHLFPTNEKVRQHNEECLARNQLPVALLESLNNSHTARLASSALAQGLSGKLYLSIGCRIMLRKNLCVTKGLVNGALGTVRQIVFKQEERPPALPYVILVEFDRYAGPYFQNNLFPIMPIVTNWKDRGLDCWRKQLPVTLAYALTIHKSQGLTLDKVVVELGDQEQAPGATYVALSRVRRLNDIIITRAVDFSRLESINRMRHILARIQFLRNMVAEQAEED